MSAPCDQPQPPKGPDEDIEPRARKVPDVVCASCYETIVWDGDAALWCDNINCPHFNIVFWNADLKQKLHSL